MFHSLHKGLQVGWEYSVATDGAAQFGPPRLCVITARSGSGAEPLPGPDSQPEEH